MLRKLTSLISSLFFAATLFAQLPSWETSYPVSGFEFQPFGVILENENSFISVNGSVFAEVCHYGFAQKTFSLPPGPVSNPWYKQYFFYESIDLPGQPYYLAANRTGVVDNDIYLHTVSEFGATGLTNFILEDNLLNHLKKGPAALKTNDWDFVIFGNENYYKVSVPDAQTINTLWTQPGNFGLIADADHHNDGFILCNEDGYLVYLDENGAEVWSKNLEQRLMAVETLQDGFILCGEVDGESALIKTDFSGEIQWQKNYGDSLAYDVIVTSDGGFAFTGTTADLQLFVTRADAGGNEIWHHYYGNGRGAKILESKYGGFLVQGRDVGEALLKRIDSNGQTGDEIDFEVNGFKKLQANNISAPATAAGKHFGDSYGKFDYNFPKGEETAVLTSGGIWLAGLDNSGDLHFAGDQYFPFFYQGGFIGSNANPNAWNKAWSVDREMIKIFRDDMADGVKDLPWAEDIITWPAKGNPNYIFINEQIDIPIDMAPFVDVNGDGIYNAFDGDYPQIKGDQMLWWVMNDNTERLSNCGAIPLGVQIFSSFYSIGCVDDDLVNNTTFLELDIQNLSPNDYTDFYMGFNSSFQIGCYQDDYAGSIPDLNAVYAYNADEVDGIPGNCGAASFTGTPPIQATLFLNQDADNYMAYNNGGIDPSPPPGTDDPSCGYDHYSYLKGMFRDGLHMTVGGDGHNYPIMGQDTTNIAFPGNPALSTGWSMCSESLYQQNRRMLISKGPLTLDSFEKINLKVALLTLTDIPQPCPDSDLIAARISELQDIFNNSDFSYSLDLGPDLQAEAGETITLDAGIGAENYLWSTGETSSEIEVSEFGIFSVTVTTSWGCELVDEIRLDNVNSDQNIERSVLKVYPNPAASQLFIELENEAPKRIYLENMMGHRLKAVEVPLGSENSTLEMNLPDTGSGIYLLRFEYNVKQAVQKLVIMK